MVQSACKLITRVGRQNKSMFSEQELFGHRQNRRGAAFSKVKYVGSTGSNESDHGSNATVLP